MRPYLHSAVALLALSGGAFAAGSHATVRPDFNREVRPILAKHCLKCHGPDDKQRQAGLRLDLSSGALAALAGGQHAVVPGKPEQSELWKRVRAAGGDVMPPAATQNPLTPAEKDVLKRWITFGAVYEPHWAFVPPKAAPLPRVKNAAWCRNPIDYFVLARLEKEGLQPSPPADRYTLVRRVYQDLIGLPPTPEEADAFINDRAPGAYERLVDRLLASPHYGERWARRWLDLARYADTNGYEKDRQRSVWPYRDWVINALNRDMPFDQFTIEQIAGDMLPNATQEQRIATGFHRNTMLNEEGGIDPLEFRYYAMTDRVATTGTTWLGLTVGCAQCHTHKYDPIPHREYYQFMAFLDNTEEPEMEVRKPEIAAQRDDLEKRIASLEADLPNRFPANEEMRWTSSPSASAKTRSGAAVERLPDGSLRISGTNPETDSYTVSLESAPGRIGAVRLEALTDPSLGHNGPGRTPHGNFVLTEISATVSPAGKEGAGQPVKLVRAQADFAQDGFPAQNALDGNQKTGWAIDGPEPWNVNRSITLYLDRPLELPKGGRWTLRLDQEYGGHHTLGRFRISFGDPVGDEQTLAARRREALDRAFASWLKKAEADAVRWTVLPPVEAKSNLPMLTTQPDGSVLATGDMTKRDVYDLAFHTDLKGITAIRLEALPDDSLPKHGPGRVFYEGAPGDFFLSEITLAAGGKPVKIDRAAQSFGSAASLAIDNEPQTGWSINGGQGQAHSAVFHLAQPLTDGDRFSVQMVFERYFAAALGHFRISVTNDPRAGAAGPPAEVEQILTLPAEKRSAAQKEQLLRHYVSIAPELAGEREAIRQLRQGLPSFPTALVMRERPAFNPRVTYVHRRGEFLQPTEKVEPGILSALGTLPASAPRNRLTFAKWLASPANPLVGRVTVNRQWAAFFGTGIVRTTEDFGYQGEPPSHPALLDWLASSFVAGAGGLPAARTDGAAGNPGPGARGEGSAFGVQGSAASHRGTGAPRKGGGLGALSPAPGPRPLYPGMGWSLKKLHRLIVTSATYLQSSRVRPEQLAKDPQNRLLARGPRFRLEAELVRDTALKESGLLSEKIGGPSVFPPQPPGVTSEGTYGPLAWKVSEGEDRYRRGLYTFSKRTAPYAMFIAFDAPSGEACVARREVSNTPLQALTLMNDAVFVETSQALGRMVAQRAGSLEDRAAYLFRRVLTRPPSTEEQVMLVVYWQTQKARLDRKDLNPASIAGPGADAERAAWTLLARSLFNVDEAVTKE